MIIEEIKEIILNLCGEDENWKNHILSTVKHSKELANLLKANEEIVEIAAWLHDISKIKGTKEGHHIIGSEEAVKILREKGYPENKISLIHHCILTHSSDKKYLPVSLEAKIVASADALCYFDNFIELTHNSNLKFGKDLTAQKEWIIKKYAKSWDKMMPEARELVKEKYEAIKLLLS